MPFLLLLAAGLLLDAQPQPLTVFGPGKPADLQALFRTLQAARRTATLDAQVQARVDQLLADGARLMTEGRSGAARRNLGGAWTLLSGKPWDEQAQFAWSLVVRPDRFAADPALPFLAQLAQVYATPYKPAGALRLRYGAQMANLGNRDLIDQPLRFELDLKVAPEGPFPFIAELFDGDNLIVKFEQTVHLVRGIETSRADVEQRLAKLSVRREAAATVRYPFDVARQVNLGLRRLGTLDFGLREDGTQQFDFVKAFRASTAMLKQLEAGRDPQWHAKGDQERHYWLEEAKEIMPYRIYVPSKWDAGRKLPMLLVLHGATRDHDFYFDRDGGLLAKLAERHGYIVATPLGYRPNGGYNASRRPGPQGELSEKDVMNVLNQVTKEYNVDPARVFLYGHSMGGAGSWYIGTKYAERFAGVAISAAGTRPDGVPFDRLKGKPLMVLHGTKDDEAPIANTRAMVKAAQEHGLKPVYHEVDGATHGTIVAMGEPMVFDFFDAVK